MKKMFSLALALIMALALSVPAFAQDVGTDAADKATITISNAAKGETYTIYKLFDATVAGDGPINYTGTIPASLADYFEADSAGNITATEAAYTTVGEGDAAVKEMSAGLKEALGAWAATATAAGTVVSDGSVLNFNGLDYGYYVVTTSQGDQTISVDSTNPDVTIYDKNQVDATFDKTINDSDVYVGQQVTYTLTFATANFDGAGEEAELITEYVVHDTLPEFLSEVTVTSITIKQGDEVSALETQQFNAENEITIPWVDANNASLYKNGSVVTITYTAIINGEAEIDVANVNEATLTWSDKTLDDDAEFYTFAFDVVKTTSDATVLDGAKFELYDAKVGGNKIALIVDGENYRVATEAEQSVEGFESAVIEAGEATIIGLSSGTYYLEETLAPDGYNMLTERVEVVIDGESNYATVTEGAYVEGGVQVINNAGIELPSTGGVGTTIFYVVGGLMMAAAGVLLVTKKKVANEEE